MTNRVLPTDIRDLKRLRPGVDDTSGAAIVVRQGDEAKVIEADWLIQADLNSRTAAESARIAQRAADAVTAPLQVVAGVAPQIQALAPVADKIAAIDPVALDTAAAEIEVIKAAPANALAAETAKGEAEGFRDEAKLAAAAVASLDPQGAFADFSTSAQTRIASLAKTEVPAFGAVVKASASISDMQVVFQTAIDALPASGGIIAIAAGDYRTLNPAALSYGDKAITFDANSGALLPDGMPGAVTRRGLYQILDSSLQAPRPTRIINYLDLGNALVSGNRRIYGHHVVGFLPDSIQGAEAEMRGFSADLGTNTSSNQHDIRAIKTRVWANGGNANIRSGYFFAEAIEGSGHTGQITGMLATIYKNGTSGNAIAVRAGIDAGCQSGVQVYLAKGTSPDAVTYGYITQPTGGGALRANVAHFAAAAGGPGDGFVKFASETDTSLENAVFRAQADGRVKGLAYYSGAVTIADDAVYSFVPVNTFGLIEVWGGANGAEMLAKYRVASSPLLNLLAKGSSTDLSTSPLVGTSGVDGHLTVAAASDGKIYIENRLGSAAKISWRISAS